MFLAQNLKYLRAQKGINQNEMADILGISQSAVGNWEQNHRKPDIEMIIRLAEYFDVRMIFIIRIFNCRKGQIIISESLDV